VKRQAARAARPARLAAFTTRIAAHTGATAAMTPVMAVVVAMATALAPGAAALPAMASSPAAAGTTSVSFRAPASYRSWKLEASGAKTTVAQVHVPFTASVGLGASTDLVVSGALGFSSLKPDSGRSLTLNGPADVTAQAFLRAAGNRLLLQVGVNLPTGKRKLGTDQLAVSRALAHPLLAFRLKQYGQGTDLNAGLAVALPLAPAATLGVGAGRIFRGAYPLGDGMKDFEPSGETAISTGLDLGEKGGTGPTARLDAVYRFYGTDRQGGIKIFEPGNQAEFQLAARVGDRGLAAEVTGRLVFKADDRYLSPGTQGEPQALRPGTYSRLTAAGDAPLGGRLRGGISVEWTGFSGGDLPGLDGSAYGGGPQLRLPLGRNGTLSVGGSYLHGTLDASGTTPRTDLSGFAACCSLAWRMGP
jgi:hypothetical protein